MGYLFEWDSRKAKLNLKNHEVTFVEATTVFLDPLSLTVMDTAHSNHEVRYIDIGTSAAGRVLVVVYTERSGIIRIISARLASPEERRTYEEG